jgi:poly(3-hydroxybutyrate) depolymerase
VHVLQIHGDADMTVKPAGGQYMNQAPYPSLMATVDAWATKNGCTGTLSDTGRIDLERTLAGDETRQQEVTGCAGGSVSLWTVEGGTHMLWPVAGWPEIMWSYFEAHPAVAR